MCVYIYTCMYIYIYFAALDHASALRESNCIPFVAELHQWERSAWKHTTEQEGHAQVHSKSAQSSADA